MQLFIYNTYYDCREYRILQNGSRKFCQILVLSKIKQGSKVLNLNNLQYIFIF